MAETGAILRGDDVVKRNMARVREAVENHLFGPAVEAACRLVVNESRSHTRPLAWNDVTGNLRASISFQVEDVVGPRAVFGHDSQGTARAFNTVPYRSGIRPGKGENGIVFAPPDYAIHVEAKSSRSVLIEPMNTVRDELRKEMRDEGRKAFSKFVIARKSLGGIT